ncbi:MAG: metalloregulator ArsR/SmtB family transcription factor [Planctomycetota bacterium]
MDPCAHDQTPDTRSPAKPVIEQAARYFRALGDPARLRVICELADRELCVSELAELTGDTLSTVSQRLRVLRADGLVVRRRDGKHIHYALSDGHVSALVANGIEHATEESAPAQEDE